ncbi:MAG TPA: hypothetical protein VN768_03945 [Acidimicrobiales bacterium]|nr:hypothetical protein [Acidimicrobiales bacterium]
MRPARKSTRVRLWGATVAAVAVAAYCWWSTGLRPFTVPAYAAVGLPVVALAVVAAATRGAWRRATHGSAPGRTKTPNLGLRRVLPWTVLLAAAAGLEGAGLALGGRSSSVPTLSTVVDHALAWHVVRFVMFAAWLAVGFAPTIRPRWRHRYDVALR